MKLGIFALAFAGAVATTLVTQFTAGSVARVITGRRYQITMKAVGTTFTPELIEKMRSSVASNGDSIDAATVNPDGRIALFVITYRRDGNLRLNSLVPDEADASKGIFIQNVEAL